MADTLLPIISSDVFSVIGTTFPKEYKEIISANGDFSSVFSKIKVEEISEDDAKSLLTFSSIIMENQYQNKIFITFPAVKTAVAIARRFLHDTPLPSSADNLLKEAAADVCESHGRIVDRNAVISIAERKINIPLHQIKEEEASTLLNLETLIHQKLVDQEEAVKAIADCLRQYRSGLQRKGGPIASFLFVGPTGVGKTELSKILAAIQFGSPSLMIRFDMSEFQDKQSFFRLIGSPDGTVGGRLTEEVSAKPFSLILLDEFEKSHPDILNLFLQVLDDGRLTDNLGRTVSFENTIIIATSNAYSEVIKERLELGQTMADISADLKKNLVSYFKPELLNRFSRIIAFKNLSLADTKKIASLQLAKLGADLLQDKNITLKFTDAAVAKIAELGYNPAFGARPLRETMDDKIKNPLAEKILKQEVKPGGVISIDFTDNNFSFTKS